MVDTQFARRPMHRTSIADVAQCDTPDTRTDNRPDLPILECGEPRLERVGLNDVKHGWIVIHGSLTWKA